MLGDHEIFVGRILKYWNFSNYTNEQKTTKVKPLICGFLPTKLKSPKTLMALGYKRNTKTIKHYFN
jgi:hypothetical protein